MAASVFINMSLRLGRRVEIAFASVLIIGSLVPCAIFIQKNTMIFAGVRNIPDMASDFVAIEKVAEETVAAVNLAITLLFTVATLLMLRTILNAAKMASSSSFNVKRLVKLLGVQVLASITLTVASYLEITQKNDYTSTEGDIYGSKAQEWHEQWASNHIVGELLYFYGNCVMSYAQILALSSSSSSSSSSADTTTTTTEGPPPPPPGSKRQNFGS